MIIISGSVRIRADRRPAAVEAAVRMAVATRAEAGCVTYRFAANLEDPDHILIYEEWETAEALASHFASPHMAAFQQELPGLLAGAPEIKRFSASPQA